MEQGIDSTISVEKGGAPRKNVRLDVNDHHMIVGAVANHSEFKVEDAQSGIEPPRKKRPRIKRKLE